MEKHMLGVMLDCSRGAVMTVEFLKGYADRLAALGYNTVMLYTEDTYEVEGEPLFGYMRGRYTADELRELDAYFAARGIELIPCIQTLAHLEKLFRFPEYREVRDMDNILLCGAEATYALIERMFAACRKGFSTRRIHIGMDEAHNVGLGRYLDEHGYENRFDIINRHLHRVCELAKKYDFEPMIWSDMFCKLAAGMAGNRSFYEADPEKVRACVEKADLPDNVTLVYWDYYSTDPDRYARNIRVNKAFGRPVIFAGGAWTWRGYGPDNTYSIAATEAALRACREGGVQDVFFTSWGDGGSECPRDAILPALAYAAAAARGEPDLSRVKADFRRLFGVDFDRFMALDLVDCAPDVCGDARRRGAPARTLLVNDPFLGDSDDRCAPGDNARCAAVEQTLRGLQDGPFGLLFRSAADLCAVLKFKAELGLRTRAAYRAGDRDALRALAETEYGGAIAALPVFLASFRALWNSQNKPFGFEMHETRLGGLLCRLESCRDRLLAYANGGIADIPELAEDSVREIRRRGAAAKAG